MTDVSTVMADFWDRPPYEPYVKESLTDAALAAFEDQYRVRLPQAMVALLRQQNGGYTNWTFPMADDSPNVNHHVLVGIGPGFPALEQTAWWQTPETEDEWQPEDPMGLISFDGEGHWDLCLDYRASAVDSAGYAVDPRITAVDCEMEEETAVADTFEAYLARLVREEEAAAAIAAAIGARGVGFA